MAEATLTRVLADKQTASSLRILNSQNKSCGMGAEDGKLKAKLLRIDKQQILTFKNRELTFARCPGNWKS